MPNDAEPMTAARVRASEFGPRLATILLGNDAYSAWLALCDWIEETGECIDYMCAAYTQVNVRQQKAMNEQQHLDLYPRLKKLAGDPAYLGQRFTTETFKAVGAAVEEILAEEEARKRAEAKKKKG